MTALRLALLPILAMLLASCGGDTDPRVAETDEFTLPSGSANKSLLPATTSVTGTFGIADVEGGCPYLESQDGTRYQVVYPDGWAVDTASGQLRADDGRVVEVGEIVTVRGSVATDRASTCQIGPIFVATEVELPGD